VGCPARARACLATLLLEGSLLAVVRATSLRQEDTRDPEHERAECQLHDGANDSQLATAKQWAKLPISNVFAGSVVTTGRSESDLELLHFMETETKLYRVPAPAAMGSARCKLGIR
jgi:hypothetical protein